MALKKKFFSDESGASLLLIALCIPLLLTVVGITVDLGRVYAARTKAQQALDAGLLGAVATANTSPVSSEALHLFNANYPANYMGSTVSGFSVSKDDDNNIYNGTLSLRVPSAILQMFGYTNTDLSITSQVTSSQDGIKELTLVLDNSSGVDVAGMITATQSFTNSLFGTSSSLPNTYISVVPFNVAVNVGTQPIAKIGWAQSSILYLLYSGGGNNGFFANRNPDIPTDGSYADVSDTPPGVPLTARFRTPYAFAPGLYLNGDGVSTTLAPMWFGTNSKSDVINALQKMVAAGSTRVNVGMMWSWFTLSDRWTGVWDAGKPGLPLPAASNHPKSIIMIVGSKNNVYLGGNQTCGIFSCAVSNDDTTTAAMCAAIKAKGIAIYAIGYGPPSNYNGAQVAACSSGAGYSFTAPNKVQLTTVLAGIVDNINYTNIRLTQ